jgi:hypothetical protein
MTILNLAGIDFRTVVEKFRQGTYNDLTRKDVPVVKIKVIKITRGAISSYYDDARFQIYDPHNRRLTVLTCNQTSLGSLRLCEWHRLPLSPNNAGIGVPTSLQTHTDENGVLHNHFYGEGLYCSWSCMLTDCERSWRYGTKEQQLARQMWYSAFPDKPLPSLANDYRLLVEHSGDMTYEEWASTSPAEIWPASLVKLTLLPGHYITTD